MSDQGPNPKSDSQKSAVEEKSEGLIGPKKVRAGVKRKTSNKTGSKTSRGARKFPANTLEEALKIPLSIKQYNGGNPWTPTEVAQAVGLSVKNPKFYYLTGSSRDYGLTTGSSITKEIALTDLGRKLAYPTSKEAEAAATRVALFNVDVFKAVFEYYKGGELPEIKYLSNTLETQFKLAVPLHKEFHQFYNVSRAYLSSGSGDAIEEIGGDKPNQDSAPVVVGQPKGKTSLRAFVAMPFSEKTDSFPKGFFDEVLRNLITPAGVAAGFKVETARRDGSDIIQSTIVNELLEADLVIADLTEHNPNVLFELGLRIAFEKPIVLIKAEGTPAVFDVDAMMRVASYNPSLWKSTLELDIPKMTAHIAGAWESRKNPQTWLKLLKKSGA
jgi:hypothetical protein